MANTYNKHSTIVNYNSRVVLTINFIHFKTKKQNIDAQNKNQNHQDVFI